MAEAGPFVVTVAQAVVLARCPLYRHEVPHVPLHMLPNRPLRRAQANSATRQDSQHATHAYAVLYATLPYATLPYPALYTNYSAASAAKQIDVATPRRPCCSHAALSGPSSSTFLFPPPHNPDPRALPSHARLASASVRGSTCTPARKLPSPSPSPLPYSASPLPVVPGALSQIASDRYAQALHTCCFHPWAFEEAVLQS
ncbi:hypothetical protein COCCADRAFT_24146 [Bipolaris zeicola 26-R-13]|uniref:Uncharacterized protein n=1 Tax=Cochliobolus carbonum (strain 26-R-13) TaxID=930089 RepID=W6Y8P9_COCC2|nr:uncharacterized protein COCCADRAFT_24146 [Bipolaris zeicola 26-R-13]EUC35992.1 hypothetical protein COCCADRAFT_24146 [Bipolaris zeicola 26-R-13]